MGEFCGGITYVHNAIILASSIKSGAPPILIQKSGPRKKIGGNIRLVVAVPFTS